MTVALALLALDLSTADITMLADTLSPAERARAGRYRAPDDRRRFVTRRGQVRCLLADQIGCAPDTIVFEEGPFGKPFVRGGPWFSISHSGGVALCATSTHSEIGCDIERRDPRLANRAIAERLFAPGECRALDSLPADRWLEGFFNGWTRKEAVVKALGTGLSCPLDSFEVALAPGAPAALLTPLGGLRLHAFAPLPDHHVAICVASDAPVPPPRWWHGSETCVAAPPVLSEALA